MALFFYVSQIHSVEQFSDLISSLLKSSLKTLLTNNRNDDGFFRTFFFPFKNASNCGTEIHTQTDQRLDYHLGRVRLTPDCNRDMQILTLLRFRISLYVFLFNTFSFFFLAWASAEILRVRYLLFLLLGGQISRRFCNFLTRVLKLQLCELELEIRQASRENR